MEGESEPHHLADSEKAVFERGGMDMFLLTTPFSIGELQSIRVWHDNSGEHPAWYGTPNATNLCVETGSPVTVSIAASFGQTMKQCVERAYH